MPSRRVARCPPGVLCLSSGVIYIIIAIGIVLTGIFIMLASKYYSPQVASNLQVQPSNLQVQPNIYISQKGGDDRYTRAPEPLKIWDGLGVGRGFSTTNLPINIPTQGYPDNFSSYGVFTTEDGKMLPLYGRRSTGSSSRFNYYTRTDTYNPVPIPLSFKKRDCMDDIGCEEIFDKDIVKIRANGTQGKVTIYKFDAPKYIP